MANKKTELELLADQFRNQEISINRFGENKQYSSTLVENDTTGNDNLLTSKVDIQTRTQDVVINKYGPENQYSVTLVDNDTSGKESLLNSPIDTQTRTQDTVINQYGPTKSYPDFTI